jgi:hypothetical protein
MDPVRVSENGRYIVGADGAPVFWLGTTQWALIRDYTLDEASLILEKSAATGFAFAQVMLLGPGDGTLPNRHGDRPWDDDSPLAPNEAYFCHVDAVVEAARQSNVIISMTVFHRRQYEHITVENARFWARWIAQRYRDVPTIVWSLTPEAKLESIPVLRELAAGLREGDGGLHLITCKPDPGPHGSGFLHAEPWLDFNSIQTWTWVDLIYPMVSNHYGLAPTKPVLMAEGAYEQGSEYAFDVTPLWVRRQAYYSYLAGAHHAYGHNDSWRVLPTWRQALEAPGAAQLGILRRVFEERDEWWNLESDQSLLMSGGQTEGRVLNLAARHTDGRWALVYCGSQASISLDLSRLAGRRSEGFWIDPRSGEPLPVGRFANLGERTFATPAGWEDALLVVQNAL